MSKKKKSWKPFQKNGHLIAQIFLHIFCSAAELSASWQHNTALAGAADQDTPKHHSKET